MAVASSKGPIMAEEQVDTTSSAIELATELTIAWLSNPNVRAVADEVPAFLRKMHETIGALSTHPEAEATPATPEHVPAVPVRSSVKPDYLISLIDGRKLKSLKRHLSTHGLTPKEYRARYGLKPDYPMVASNYSAQRREVAQKIGLGRKVRTAVPAAVVAKTTATAKAVRAAAKPAVKSPRRTRQPQVEAAPKPIRRARVGKEKTPA